MQNYSKAIAGGLAGAVLSGGLSVPALPEGSPAWAYVAVAAIGAAVTIFTVYWAPANKA